MTSQTSSSHEASSDCDQRRKGKVKKQFSVLNPGPHSSSKS